MVDITVEEIDGQIVRTHYIGRRAQRLKEREVYFVQGVLTGLVKIGVSDPQRMPERIRALASQSPDKIRILGVMPCFNYGQLEKDLHKRFRPAHAHAEWFFPLPSILQWIDDYAGRNTARISKLQAHADREGKFVGRPRKNKQGAKVVKLPTKLAPCAG